MRWRLPPCLSVSLAAGVSEFGSNLNDACMLESGQGARTVGAALVAERTKGRFYHAEVLGRKRWRSGIG